MAETLTPDAFDFKEKVLALRTKILEKHPDMPVLLGEIHKAIKQNPDQVTLLEEEDIQTIVNGLEIHTGTALISAAVQGKGNKSIASKIKTQGLAAFGG